jgi:hypothetical protein
MPSREGNLSLKKTRYRRWQTYTQIWGTPSYGAPLICDRVSPQALASEGCAVAIYQLIRTLSLNPEEVEKLTTAYEKALTKLQLSNRTDRIIEAAKTGVRDPDQLCAMAIKDLRVHRPPQVGFSSTIS